MKNSNKTLFFLVLAALNFATDASTVIVDSPIGKIRGVKKTHIITGIPYETFRGIPYAKPPVGELRFAKPQPHPHFEDIFDATADEMIVCHQSSVLAYMYKNTREDCLVLNIDYKERNASDKSLKKVMVYIHGGGFFGGATDVDDFTSFFISEDIIGVTINYRLNILGFLSTEDEASPGNYGLWDQVLALKWVKDNIRSFGGDPNDITIAGESAGAISAGYLLITPHAKGLFTKAYLHSGTATTASIQSDNFQLHALDIAKSVGCWGKETDYKLNVNESKTVIECLRNISVSELKSASTFSQGMLHFVPRVDNDFILDIPMNLLKDDAYLDSVEFYNRSFLIAFNNYEKQLMELYIKGQVQSINNKSSEEEKEIAWQEYKFSMQKLYMQWRYGRNQMLSDGVINQIDIFYKSRFFPQQDLIEFLTDLSFLIPSYDYMVAASRRTSCNAYFLYFNHFPEFMTGPCRGVPHSVNFIYFNDWTTERWAGYPQIGMGGNFTQVDAELKKSFVSLLGEFTRTGNPGKALKNDLPCGWPKYDALNAQYLDFHPNPWIGTYLEREKMEFWFNTIPNLLNDQNRRTEV